MKKGRKAAFFCALKTHAEKDEPQPQVDVALGFLMTN
jgi:hypothetical protein